MSKVLKIVAKVKSKLENLCLLLSLHLERPAGKASYTKLHKDLAGQLVDTRFADRWRCRNQNYLDYSDLTLTKNHKRKKNSM